MTVRCLAVSSKTGLVIGEIPFESCSITTRLNDKGSFTLSAPMRFLAPSGVETLTVEGFDVNRSSVVFLRGGVPIFAGLLESENGEITENGDESFSVGGPDLALGYMGRRVNLSSIATTADQFSILSTIVSLNNTFGVPITVVKEPALSGVVRTRAYSPVERKIAYDLIKELAAVEDGFDFIGGVTGDQATGFQSTITVGYPNLKRVTGLTLALGKNVKRIAYAKDGHSYCNLFQVGGANRGLDSAIPATAINVGDLTTYPYMQRTESRSTVLEQSTLVMWANRGLRLYGTTPIEYQVEVDPSDPDCQIGSFRPGDTFRLIAKRGRLQIDSTYRVVEWTLSIDADGEEKLSIRLMLSENVT